VFYLNFKIRETPVLGTPPIVKRSEQVRGEDFPRKKHFLQTKVCHVRVTVDLPTFCPVTIFSVESKELELKLEQPKKKVAIPVCIKELGKYIQKKFNKYVNIEG